jgi:hypothetical protein
MASEITSTRNTSLLKLIDEVAGHIGDLARWPDSQATRETADNSIKLLRKAFAEAGYPHAFLYMAMVQIAGGAYSEAALRADDSKVNMQAMKQAWIKIADLLCKG